MPTGVPDAIARRPAHTRVRAAVSYGVPYQAMHQASAAPSLSMTLRASPSTVCLICLIRQPPDIFPANMRKHICAAYVLPTEMSCPKKRPAVRRYSSSQPRVMSSRRCVSFPRLPFFRLPLPLPSARRSSAPSLLSGLPVCPPRLPRVLFYSCALAHPC